MRRRILIDICLRRIRPGTGSIRLPIQWKPVMQLNFLPHPYIIVGGVATRAYMPFRETLDLDILIHSDDRTSTRCDGRPGKPNYDRASRK